MDLVAVLEESNPLDAALRDGPGAKTVWLFHLRETHSLLVLKGVTKNASS